MEGVTDESEHMIPIFFSVNKTMLDGLHDNSLISPHSPDKTDPRIEESLF